MSRHFVSDQAELNAKIKLFLESIVENDYPELWIDANDLITELDKIEDE